MTSSAKRPSGQVTCETLDHGRSFVEGGQSEMEYYDRVRLVLQRALAKHCPGWLSSSRDDLLQSAMSKVFELCDRQRKIEGGKASESSNEFTATYLWRVAQSTLIDEIRRFRRRKELPLTQGPLGASGEELRSLQPPHPAPNPEQRAIGKGLGRAIGSCLSRMVSSRRRAVVLHLQGHSVPEISRFLESTAKRTDNLVYRGLSDLRACLKLEGLEP